ncbi:MAG: hypothetical protein ACTSVW_07420 [Candidatus Njordarchaeales archaeon]
MNKDKKKRRSIFDAFFEGFFSDFDELFEGFPHDFSEGISGGYSISVTQTPEGTVVHAKIGDDMDRNEFKKMLEERYPGAKIVIEGGKDRKAIIRVEEETPEQKTQEKREEKKEASEEKSILDALFKKKSFIIRED